jgi:3-dehydroquinate dehydratase-2
VKILVLHGPNLNLLGSRETDVYGSRTLAELESEIREVAAARGVEVDFHQANDEGSLIDRIQAAGGDVIGIVLNPGGYTHSSVAIRDAVSAQAVPTVEVHLSNVHAREAFRRRSVVAGACWGQITGLGVDGYLAAISALVERAGREPA